MAGTRTVHRGSKGRFAGASGGKAEQVRVSRRSGGNVAGRPQPVKGKRQNTKGANAARIDRKARRSNKRKINIGTVLYTGGAVAAITAGSSDKKFVGGIVAAGAGWKMIKDGTAAEHQRRANKRG